MILAMFGPEWRRQTVIAVLILLALAAVFLRATTTSGQAERTRRLWFALLAFVGSPFIAALMAGLVHAFGQIHPLDVGHTYSSFLVIGIIAGSILGLFFVGTSRLCSNGPESSPRKSNP